MMIRLLAWFAAAGIVRQTRSVQFRPHVSIRPEIAPQSFWGGDLHGNPGSTQSITEATLFQGEQDCKAFFKDFLYLRMFRSLRNKTPENIEVKFDKQIKKHDHIHVHLKMFRKKSESVLLTFGHKRSEVLSRSIFPWSLIRSRTNLSNLFQI